MTLGPLEYTVIGFEGNNFDGSIADELSRVIDSGVISVVDLVFVGKGNDGNLRIVELDNKEDPRFAGFAPMLQGLTGLLTEEDIEEIGADSSSRTRRPSSSCSSIAGRCGSRRRSATPAASSSRARPSGRSRWSCSTRSSRPDSCPRSQATYRSDTI